MWIKQTFQDDKNRASFKRQALFLIIINAIIGMYCNVDITALVALASIIAALTVAEKSKKL